MKNIPKNREGESISVYGIQKDSKYVSAELFEDGVTISDGYAEKYGMKVGDTLELKEPYEDKTYSFEVKSIYAYPGALAVFLPMMSSARNSIIQRTTLTAISPTSRSRTWRNRISRRKLRKMI